MTESGGGTPKMQRVPPLLSKWNACSIAGAEPLQSIIRSNKNSELLDCLFLSSSGVMHSNPVSKII